MHFHGYLISWFFKSLRKLLYTICNLLDIWICGYRVTSISTKIDIQRIIMNPYYWLFVCWSICLSSFVSALTWTNLARFLWKLYHRFISAMSHISSKISVDQLFLKVLCPLETLIIWKIAFLVLYSFCLIYETYIIGLYKLGQLWKLVPIIYCLAWWCQKAGHSHRYAVRRRRQRHKQCISLCD